MRVASRARLGGSSGGRPALARRAFASSPATLLTILRAFLVLFAPLPRAGAYSSHPGSCDARSGHGALDSGDGGYTLTRASGALHPGERVVLTLSKPLGGADFAGFVISASAGTLLEPKSTNAAAAPACNSGNSVGHSSASPKSTAEAYLTLPSAGGVVEVKAHVVVHRMTVHEITLRRDVPSSSSSNDLPSPRGCSASSLGYRCVVALAPSVNLHWTSGGAAEAEDEPEADAAPESSSAEPEFSSAPSGAVAFALETTDASARMASVAFQSTRMMVPSVAVVGYVSDDGADAHVGSYDVRGYSVAGLVGPGASSLPIRNASAERTSRGSLIVRFAANITDVGMGRFDGTASGDAHVGWALASRAAVAYHDGSHGAVAIDFADAASAVRADTRVAARRNRTHGALMLAGFSAMLAGSVAAFLGKAFAEETREDEKTKTRRQTRRQTRRRTAMENGTRDATENETANEGHDEERAEAETKETETRKPPWKLHAHKLASVLGSAWIHAHRASQIAGATLALAGFAVALTREETETRAPFEWGSYTFDGDEETAAAERAAVAHGVVGVVVVAVVAAQFARRRDAPPKRRRRKIRPKRRLRGRFATRTSSSGGSPPSSGWPTASSGRGSRGGEARTRARRDSSSSSPSSPSPREAWRSSPR